MNLQFHYIEKLWLSFWNSKASSGDGPASLPARCLPCPPETGPMAPPL